MLNYVLYTSLLLHLGRLYQKLVLFLEASPQCNLREPPNLLTLLEAHTLMRTKQLFVKQLFYIIFTKNKN